MLTREKKKIGSRVVDEMSSKVLVHVSVLYTYYTDIIRSSLSGTRVIVFLIYRNYHNYIRRRGEEKEKKKKTDKIKNISIPWYVIKLCTNKPRTVYNNRHVRKKKKKKTNTYVSFFLFLWSTRLEPSCAARRFRLCTEQRLQTTSVFLPMCANGVRYRLDYTWVTIVKSKNTFYYSNRYAGLFDRAVFTDSKSVYRHKTNYSRPVICSGSSSGCFFLFFFFFSPILSIVTSNELVLLWCGFLFFTVLWTTFLQEIFFRFSSVISTFSKGSKGMLDHKVGGFVTEVR